MQLSCAQLPRPERWRAPQSGASPPAAPPARELPPRPPPATTLTLLLAGSVLFAAGSARAQRGGPARGAEGSLHIYADDDEVTVITPSASAWTPLSDTLALDVATTVDVVTAASVDVVTQASPYTVYEQRVEAGAGLAWTAGRLVGLSGRVVGSTENDYRSLHLSVGARLETPDRNGSLDLAYTAAVDQVGRAGDPAFDRARRGHRLTLTGTEVLGPRTYADLVLDGEIATGYQANPYRYVPILDAGGGSVSLAERVPGERHSGAALVRLRRAVSDRVYLHGDYRLYGDSWGIVSHTASASGLVAVAGGRATLGLTARGYTQGAAVFYRAEYSSDAAGVPAWRTRDRALGGMRTLSATVVADVVLTDAPADDAPHLVGALGLIRFTFHDFPPQARRDAVVASAQVLVPF